LQLCGAAAGRFVDTIVSEQRVLFQGNEKKLANAAMV